MSNPDANGGQTTTATAASRAKADAQPRAATQTLPPFNVILLNDDDHTYDYVILMLRRIFGFGEDRGQKLAKTVDSEGRAILMTTHREHAELKRDQVLSFGADPRLSRSRGSMTAIIEPAEEA